MVIQEKIIRSIQQLNFLFAFTFSGVQIDKFVNDGHGYYE
jgi:hypothetical protein